MDRLSAIGQRLPARTTTAICVAVTASAVIVSNAVVAAPLGHGAYRDGPPPGFSGGFGEQSCSACHFSGEDNEGTGDIEIEAPAEGFNGGDTYEVLLTLRRPGMALAGFQVTARFDDGGAQAGSLSASPADDDRVTVSSDQGIEYAYQIGSGSEPSSDGVSQWTLQWTAPTDASGDVTFNVAANAANGDDTAEGDEVYTASVTVSPSQN